jgi:hypothetical protein
VGASVNMSFNSPTFMDQHAMNQMAPAVTATALRMSPIGQTTAAASPVGRGALA